jgi:hypothetical protein
MQSNELYDGSGDKACRWWELLRSSHSSEAGVASNPAASLPRRRALTRPFRLPLRSGSFAHFSHPGRGARLPILSWRAGAMDWVASRAFGDEAGGAVTP